MTPPVSPARGEDTATPGAPRCPRPCPVRPRGCPFVPSRPGGQQLPQFLWDRPEPGASPPVRGGLMGGPGGVWGCGAPPAASPARVESGPRGIIMSFYVTAGVGAAPTSAPRGGAGEPPHPGVPPPSPPSPVPPPQRVPSVTSGRSPRHPRGIFGGSLCLIPQRRGWTPPAGSPALLRGVGGTHGTPGGQRPPPDTAWRSQRPPETLRGPKLPEFGVLRLILGSSNQLGGPQSDLGLVDLISGFSNCKSIWGGPRTRFGFLKLIWGCSNRF